MAASLTGFGRAEFTDAAGRVACEIKSVNNRFLQFDMHLPFGCNWLDGLLRNTLSEKISRGKVNVHVEVVDYTPSAKVVVNRSLVRNLLDLQKELEEETGRAITLNLDGLLALPAVLKADSEKPDQEKQWLRIQPVVEQALGRFCDSRKREGANLAKDILERRQNLAGATKAIEERLPAFREAFTHRFNTRIRELAGQAGVDDGRLATEVALWADRSDVSEELIRLKSHLQELEKILQSSQPIGRRLDFLVQELNRESNTLGNKIGDLLVIQQVLDMKCEIEKIREQAQNIE